MEIHFGRKKWQTKWRKDQYVRLYDVTSMKCKEQALLALGELGQ
jgi:hypothetical protein